LECCLLRIAGVFRLLLAIALSVLFALQTNVAEAQPTPTYLSHPQTLDDPELEQSFAEDAKREPVAQPEGPRVDFDQRPLVIGAMLGFGTPVGELGAIGTYTLAPPVSLGVGAGTNGQGIQLTTLAIVRPFSWARRKAAHAISFMPALSTGRWRSLYLDLGLSHDGPQERANYVVYAVDQAYWFQADVAYELLTRSGFWLRAGYGLAWMLNPGDSHCEFLQSGARTSCGDHSLKGEPADAAIPTFSVVIGYALDGSRR
jgi:hypothetical protein